MSGIDFTDRVIVITGAHGGLGRAYVRELARRGGKVLAVDVAGSFTPDDETRTVIDAAGGEVVDLAEDVSTAAGGERIAQAALDNFGRIDALINNAGVLRAEPFEELTEAARDEVLAVHVDGAFNVTRPIFASMKQRGYGRILFTSSAVGLFGVGYQSAYAAAKAAVVGLMRELAHEGARHGVLSNGLAPIAATGMSRHLKPEYSDFIRPLAAALGGAMDPGFVVPVAVYLVSSACTLNGELLSAVAGRIARVVTGVTDGWVGPRDAPASVEDIAARIGEITDPARISIPGSMLDEFRLVAERIREG